MCNNINYRIDVVRRSFHCLWCARRVVMKRVPKNYRMQTSTDWRIRRPKCTSSKWRARDEVRAAVGGTSLHLFFTTAHNYKTTLKWMGVESKANRVALWRSDARKWDTFFVVIFRLRCSTSTDQTNNSLSPISPIIKKSKCSFSLARLCTHSLR